MSQERYRQIDALAEAALKMESSQRRDFLLRACGSDEDLLVRVSELVRNYESSVDFLEAPAFEAWARDLATTIGKPSLAGRAVGKYLVLSHLGSGGIGDVWLAKDQELAREVALKFLAADFAGDSEHIQRFRMEARAASSLNHPGLVTVFDIGEFEGRQYIAQEYVRGKTVREMLGAGPIEAKRVLEIATQIGAALSVAHSAGVIHRDIKPENIMVRPDGLVKILDFGLARLLEGAAANDAGGPSGLTRTGIILGTARYMSPEQARGLPADGRSDVFSLGVVLYEMLTGAAPFTGSTPSDILAAILAEDPAPFSRKVPGVPADFERIVRRCLEKNPAARYASAEALYDELRRLATKANRLAWPTMRWIVAGAAVLVVAASASTVLFKTIHRESSLAVSYMHIARLATPGEVADVAISHDGKLFAYVLAGRAGQSVWVRDSSGNQERAIVPEGDGEYSGLTFSPGDSFLYYRRRKAEDVGDVYRVPVKNGTPVRVIGEVSGAAALSPDGRRIAFVRLRQSSSEVSLMVGNADGSSEFSLETLHQPLYFDEHSVAWAPDGRSIACFTGEGRYSEATFHLVEVGVAERRHRMITQQSWMWPRSVAWSAKGDVLIVTAAARGDVAQLWKVQYGDGSVSRLTNDLSNYDHVTITDDGITLATVQRDSSLDLWVADRRDPNHFTRISASPLHTTRVGIAWTPEERIIYSNLAEDFRNLWMIDPEEGGPRRLTWGQGNKDEIALSRDGRTIVYRQSGNLWRANADGTNARQLTSGSLDVHPNVSPDGRWLVYASFADWAPGVGGTPTLWKVPIEGGGAVELSRQPASYPTLSPDGLQLGCIHFPGKDPRFSTALLATLKADGTGGFTVFQSSPSDETPLSWSPDGKSLDFVINANGVGNIWRQPIGGGPATQVTHFDRDDLFTFAWSREGRLACARGTTSGGAILIQNFH